MSFLVRQRTLVLIGVAMILVAILLGFLVHRPFITAGDAEIMEEFLEHRSRYSTSMMRFVSALFDPALAILFAVLASAAVWWRWRNLNQAIYVLACVAVSGAITHSLKALFVRNRPAEILHLVTENDFSFPSGHTTAAVALAVGCAIVISLHVTTTKSFVITWAVALTLAAIIASSRLYLGVHWFTDITAGTLIGAGSALLLFPLATRGIKKTPSRNLK